METEPPVPTAPFLIGHGYDIHRLQTGGSLRLAASLSPTEMSPIAHSDGDVVFHALVDALLGALGFGDIGEMFPNTDPRVEGCSSGLCRSSFAARQGRGICRKQHRRDDLTERPKIKPFKPQMVESLRKIARAVSDHQHQGRNQRRMRRHRQRAKRSRLMLLYCSRRSDNEYNGRSTE